MYIQNKSENKGFEFDSKGLRDWERQNNKIMSKYEGNQASIRGLMDAWDANDAWKGRLSEGDIDFVTSLVKYGKTVGDKSVIHNEKANTFMKNNTGEATDKTPE